MDEPKRKRGRPKKRRVVRRRVPKPVPLEDLKTVAASMGMTILEYVNYEAAQNRRKQGRTGLQLNVSKNLKTSTEDIDLDLRKVLKIQPKRNEPR